MKHFSIKAFDIPDAWTQVLETIYLKGDKFRVEHGSEILKQRDGKR